MGEGTRVLMKQSQCQKRDLSLIPIPVKDWKVVRKIWLARLKKAVGQSIVVALGAIAPEVKAGLVEVVTAVIAVVLVVFIVIATAVAVAPSVVALVVIAVVKQVATLVSFSSCPSSICSNSNSSSGSINISNSSCCSCSKSRISGSCVNSSCYNSFPSSICNCSNLSSSSISSRTYCCRRSNNSCIAVLYKLYVHAFY